MHRQVCSWEIFPTEGLIFRSWSRPVAIISEYTPPYHQLGEFQNESDAGTDRYDQLENSERTPLFRVAKCVAIVPSTEASVAVMTSSAELIYIAPHPNLRRNKMVLMSSGNVNTLQDVRTKVCVSNSSK